MIVNSELTPNRSRPRSSVRTDAMRITQRTGAETLRHVLSTIAGLAGPRVGRVPGHGTLVLAAHSTPLPLTPRSGPHGRRFRRMSRRTRRSTGPRGPARCTARVRRGRPRRLRAGPVGAGGGRRSSPVALAVVVLVALLVAPFIHVPYVIIAPGNATPLDSSVLQVHGAQTYGHKGDLLYLTVTVSNRDPNLYRWLFAEARSRRRREQARDGHRVRGLRGESTVSPSTRWTSRRTPRRPSRCDVSGTRSGPTSRPGADRRRRCAAVRPMAGSLSAT